MQTLFGGIYRPALDTHFNGDEVVAVIFWEIGNVSGHGSPIPLASAIAWCEHQNERWGPGTHWMVMCSNEIH